jgi:hypothetical protein
MNSTQSLPRLLTNAFLLLSLFAFAPSARGQAKRPPRLDRESLIASARYYEDRSLLCLDYS